MLEKAESGEIYHITGEERTVLEVADWICEAVKGRKLREDEIDFVDFHTARPGHDKRYALSGEKLIKLGWKQSTNLEEFVKRIVKWSSKNRDWIS